MILENLSGGEFVSGAALANSLGVSRNAVWKAVKALESEGFVIESVPAKGYRLSPESNKLAPELISCRLKKNRERTILVYDELSSTNDTAKELVSRGAAHGTAVLAEKQNGGKGRMGRSFCSPAGVGLYMSVIVHPKLELNDASLITAAAAVVTAQAVEEVCSCDVKIKWVNDLFLNGKKICGILTEASLGLEMKSLDCAVIGIGINVRSGESFPDELKDIVTSIEGETGKKTDRNVLCAAVLDGLENIPEIIENRSFLEEYRHREMLTGNHVTAQVGRERFSGIAAGVDDNASLLLKMPDGEIRHISSGEAHIVR